MKPGLLRLLEIGAVAATLGVPGFRLPAPLPGDASPALFSAIRALGAIKAIAVATLEAPLGGRSRIDFCQRGRAA